MIALLLLAVLTDAPERVPRGFLNNLSIELGAGVGAARGDFHTDPTVAYGVRLSSFVTPSIYVFAQDTWAYSRIFFDFVSPSTGLVEEDDEHITVHNAVAGGGFAQSFGDVELFGQLGVGRWIIGGTDHVRGHVVARIDAGARWSPLPWLGLSLDAGWTVGRAHIDVEDFDGEVRGAWSVLAGVRLTIGARRP